MRLFGFGDKVKEQLTGYVGKVTGIAEYCTGTIQYLVEGMDNTGRPTEFWYDERRLESAE